MRLNQDFFNRDVLEVAPQLLGKHLVCKRGKEIITAKITEVEAYRGSEDLACHASKGLTPRTKVLFGPPGHTYVYLIYGMYHCLNFVCDRQGYPAAVLIRGVDLPGGNGPGKLCRLFQIDRSYHDLGPGNTKLWIEDSGTPMVKILKAKRIGVDYAGPWKDKLWRFTFTPNEHMRQGRTG